MSWIDDYKTQSLKQQTHPRPIIAREEGKGLHRKHLEALEDELLKVVALKPFPEIGRRPFSSKFGHPTSSDREACPSIKGVAIQY